MNDLSASSAQDLKRAQFYLFCLFMLFTGLLTLNGQTTDGYAQQRDRLKSRLEHGDGLDRIPLLDSLFYMVFPDDIETSASCLYQMREMVKRYPSSENLIDLYLMQGEYYDYQGKFDSVGIAYRKGLPLSIDIGHVVAQSHFLNNLGDYHLTVGDIDSAIILLHMALEIAVNDTFTIYNNLGQAYSQKGDYTKGLNYTKLAMVYVQEHKMDGLEANLALNIGSDYLAIGNTKQAINYFNYSLQLSEKIDDKKIMLSALLNLSKAHDTPEENMVCAKRGLAISNKINDGRSIVLFTSSLADSYAAFGDYEKALDMLLKAYNTFDSPLGRERQLVFQSLSAIYLNLNQLDKAEKYGRQAYQVALSLGGIAGLQKARKLLLNTYSKQNNYKQYHEIAREYYPQRNRTDEFRRIEKFAELESALDQEQKEKVHLLNSTIIEKEKSQWRLGIIGILVFSLLSSLLYFRNRRVSLQKEIIKQEKEAAEELQLLNSKLQELDQLKSRLYTNISHEFRTPLTVILGMADQLKEHPGVMAEAMMDNAINRKLKLIQRNGSNLLELANKMLDLSKLENNSLTVDYVKGDMIKYLLYLGESFRSLMEIKNISFTTNNTYGEIIMDYDAEKMRQIISNLMSNAIKYTPQNGSIQLTVEEQENVLEITVRDNGLGISDNSLSHIFERFYQSDDSVSKAGGTGIGLALTKELVELMEGSITVESELGKGSVFRINLPIKIESKTIAEMPIFALVESVDQEVLTQNSLDNKPMVLIIEDNTDVAEYISSCLQVDYNIDFCYDGKSGADRALDTIPDLIISDVMMPEKDGYEVCEILKLDPRTSHVPIILLTAKSTKEERLQGLETGADDYLIKPFDTKELEVRVRKLIQLRKTLREQHAQSDLLIPPPASMSVIDQEFIENVIKIVNTHLNDPSFSVDVLAQGVSMSKVHLNRKLKALMGFSPNKLIQTIRLQHAYDMLRQRIGNVTEVAAATGYSSNSYFTKCFREKYEKTPSQILENR